MVDPGVDGRIILRWIFRKWDGSTDRIDLAENRDRWLALVYALMNLNEPSSSIIYGKFFDKLNIG